MSKATQTGIAQVQILNVALASKDISVLTGLPRDYFFAYQDEYDFIMSHYREYGVVPDVQTFVDHFQEFERLEVSESVDYLTKKLISDYLYKKMVPISSDFNHEAMYGDIVSASQTLATKTSEALNDLITSSQDTTDLAKNFQSWIQPDTSGRIGSGFKQIDQVTGGLRKKGGLTLIQGATGQGKSWVLIWMLHHMVSKGKTVIFYSDEMSKEEITKRLWAIHIKRPVDFFEVPHKDLTYDISGKVVILSRSDISGDVIDGLSNFALAQSADAIIVDGIKYMRDTKSDKRGYEVMEDACIRLMQVSHQRECAIIAAAQSNRDSQHGNVGSSLGTIAGSFDMLGIATLVISINRRGNIFKMKIEKSRHSADGDIFAYDFDFNGCTFTYDEESTVKMISADRHDQLSKEAPDIPVRKRKD